MLIAIKCVIDMLLFLLTLNGVLLTKKEGEVLKLFKKNEVRYARFFCCICNYDNKMLRLCILAGIEENSSSSSSSPSSFHILSLFSFIVCISFICICNSLNM